MTGRKKTGENRICHACGKEYYVGAWRLKKGNSRFCSENCLNKLQYDRSLFKCNHCMKEFEDSPSRKGKRKFCSIECDITHKSNKKIDIKKYRRNQVEKCRLNGKMTNLGPSIRKYALSNKEKKCQICGYKEYECCLDIHHIDENPSNNDLGNLSILCVMCHRKVHRKILKM